MTRILTILIAAALLVVHPLHGSAQTAIRVDISRATFAWTASVVDATHSAPIVYTVKCGTVTGVYTKAFAVTPPAVSTAVKNIVTTPGTFFCVVTASNTFGESAPSNEVTFQAVFGLVPILR